MNKMLINANIPFRFKPAEFYHFNWIYNIAPCFPLNSSKVNIIKEPREFYETLCDRFSNAKQRISVASLYIGTGALEKRLLEITTESIKREQLECSILLDCQRGTRGDVNSVTLLQRIIDQFPERCRFSLYQTPRLQGSWSKTLPSRYNELFGLQHMKLYIADNSVLLSGANCSNDYFEQRQDRYVEIEDADLANFYCELIDEVSKYSKTCTKSGIVNSKQNKEQTIQGLSKSINSLITTWKERQLERLTAIENADVKQSTMDTWIFPLIQMGEFNIKQDEQTTLNFLTSTPKGSYIQLATGYFNLTDQYAKTLLKDCKSSMSLLMAHPNANGFLGASGPAGGIPHAYSLIARKFWQRVIEFNQSSRVNLLEYERPGWTFHAKGLWYYPPGSSVPWVTIVGSANLGERSVKRDLEAQAAIFTVSNKLQEKLHEESLNLHNHASESSSELEKRKTPLWVRATVGLFRTYF